MRNGRSCRAANQLQNQALCTGDAPGKLCPPLTTPMNKLTRLAGSLMSVEGAPPLLRSSRGVAFATVRDSTQVQNSELHCDGLIVGMCAVRDGARTAGDSTGFLLLYIPLQRLHRQLVGRNADVDLASDSMSQSELHFILVRVAVEMKRSPKTRDEEDS